MLRLLPLTRWLRPSPVPTRPRRPRRPGRPLFLEQLEDRRLPAAAAGDVFLSALYYGLLGHGLDSAGESYWGGQLSAGASPAQVAAGILTSAAYQGREVQALYQGLLGHAASGPSRAFWVNLMQHGLPQEQAEADILGSDEFFFHSGGTIDGFVRALYTQVLHRAMDPAGAQLFGGELLFGTPRTTVAAQVLASQEAHGHLVEDLYRQMLLRVPDHAGAVFWVSALDHGMSPTTAEADILSSNEFLARAQAAAARPAQKGQPPATGPQTVRTFLPTPALLGLANPNAGFIGSQALLDLANGLPYGTPISTGLPGEGPQPVSTQPFQPVLDASAPTTSPAVAVPVPGAPAGGSHSLFQFDAQGRVAIYARATVAQNLSDFEQPLIQLGMHVITTAPAQNLVAGYLPVSAILSLPNVPYFAAATFVPRPVLSVGSVTTEGDAVILGPQFRASQNVDGTGVQVGVLSDSADEVNGGLAASVATGDLPSNVLVLLDDPAPNPTDEGRAMLEIVHDIAPGAALAFHTAFPVPQIFSGGIAALAAAGSKVITDDVRYFDSPFFNDGVIAQAANAVVNQGIFYTAAAGNQGSQGWQDVWRPLNTTVGGVSGTFEDFGGGNPLQTFTLPVNGEATLSFQWDSAFLEGGSPLPNFQVPNNLEVLVTTANGSNVLQTFNTNALNTGEALQIADFTNNGSYGTNNFALAFHLVTGPAPTRLRWVNLGDDIAALGQGAPTVFGQAAATGVVAVGAVDWSTPDQPESFTSLGTNLFILFDSAGNRLILPQVRNKPDVTAPDGVSTSFFGSPNPNGGFPQFFGTSAATPHVAGAVALQLQQSPFTAVTTVIQHLEQTAKDIPPTGFDGLTGSGLIQLHPLPPTSPPGTTVIATSDIFEPNNTSNTATDFGPLVTGTPEALQNMTIASAGAPDYDWYRWEPAQSGAFNVAMVVTQGGDLELHLFTLLGNTLIEVANSTAPGQVSRFLSIAANAGQPMLVEVKGRNSSFGHWDTGTYTLLVGM